MGLILGIISAQQMRFGILQYVQHIIIFVPHHFPQIVSGVTITTLNLLYNNTYRLPISALLEELSYYGSVSLYNIGFLGITNVWAFWPKIPFIPLKSCIKVKNWGIYGTSAW